jgi:hypothetical protein
MKVTKENFKNAIKDNLPSQALLTAQARLGKWPDDGRDTVIKMMNELRDYLDELAEKYGDTMEAQFKDWNEEHDNDNVPEAS